MDVFPPIRCLLPADAIGFIIGKAGATIKQMSEESGCRVDICRDGEAPSSLSDKICSLQGSENAQKTACRILLQKLWQAQSLVESDQGIFVVMIPQSAAGGVVGARGSTITDICTQTGAEINMGKDPIIGLKDRPCAITGSANQVLEGIMLVQRVLSDMVRDSKLTANDFLVPGMYGSPFGNDNKQLPNQPQFGSFNNDNNNSFGGTTTGSVIGGNSVSATMGGGNSSFSSTPAPTCTINPKQNLNSVVKVVVTSDIAGWIVGKGGAHIQEMQQNSGAHFTIKDGRPPVLPGDRVLEITGDFEAKLLGLQVVMHSIEAKPSGVPLESQMVVPSEKVKYLIGKLGAAIKQIRDQSGANIDFPRDTAGHLEDKIMTLQGTIDARVKAAQLVFTRMEELLMDEEGIPRLQEPRGSAGMQATPSSLAENHLLNSKPAISMTSLQQNTNAPLSFQSTAYQSQQNTNMNAPFQTGGHQQPITFQTNNSNMSAFQGGSNNLTSSQAQQPNNSFQTQPQQLSCQSSNFQLQQQQQQQQQPLVFQSHQSTAFNSANNQLSMLSVNSGASFPPSSPFPAQNSDTNSHMRPNGNASQSRGLGDAQQQQPQFGSEKPLINLPNPSALEQSFMNALHSSGLDPQVQLVLLLPLQMMQMLYEQGQINEIAKRAKCRIECQEAEGDCQVTLRGTAVANSLAALYLQEKLLLF